NRCPRKGYQLMRFAYVLLFAIAVVAPRTWGQENVYEQLHQVILLERQGQYAQAIHDVQLITGSNVLSRVDQGKALTLLGYAYQESGQYQLAEGAFEKALNSFEDDTQHLADLANALNFFAGLYQTIGQPQMAGKMWSKALDI